MTPAGNSAPPPGDSMGVDCCTYREALSAKLDGETTPVPDDQVESHLAECADCRSWQQRATGLSRALRVRPVEPTPDLTASVLSAARPLLDRPPRRWPRILLAGVALGQIALGQAQMLGLGREHMSGGMTGHLFNESTAWNLALGLAMLWTAWRVRASAGLVPVLAAFLVVLGGFSIYDVVSNNVQIERLYSHGLLVLGLILLIVVRRDLSRGSPHPGDARHTRPGTTIDTTGEPDTGPPPPSHRHLGPTGYRKAG